MSSQPSELTLEIVRAGAGAGKTTQLTAKVLNAAKEYFSTHQRWPRIVVTTFTRKATQELRERLVLKACETGDHGLLNFVTSKSNLHISTIHGVVSLFLQKFGHLVGVDTSFNLMSEHEARNLAEKCLKQIIFKENHVGLLDVYEFSKLLIFCRKYSSLKLEYKDVEFYSKEDFEEIYIETLSAVSSEALVVVEEIIASLDVDEKWLSYVNSLKGFCDINGLSAEESYLKIKNGLDSLGRKPTLSKKNPQVTENLNDELKSAVDNLKKFFKSKENNPAAWSSFLEVYPQIQELCDEFTDLFHSKKYSSSQLEIEDLELKNYDILRQEPQLGDAFSEEWDFWLIDEFQDTSPLQLKILMKLIGEKPYYIVGDPQQSIYLFRGSRTEVFENKIKNIQDKKGDYSLLQKNYRSKPELLVFFNEFFLSLNKTAFTAMEPKSAVENPTYCVAKMYPADEGEGSEKFLHENQAIAHHIHSLLSSGVSYQDICILGRDNKTLNEVADYLSQKQLPVHVHAASGFYKRREIIDALALLKFLVNPHDNTLLIGLLRSPWFYISDEVLANILVEKPGGSYWNFLVEKYSHLQSIKRLQQCLVKSQLKGVVLALRSILVESGVFDYSRKVDPTGRRESNLWKLLYMLSNEERKPGFNVLDFVSQNQKSFDLDSVSEESDAAAALEPNRINLMTVHSSKGLQFKHVIVVRMHKKPRLSSSLQHQSGVLWNEERHRLGVTCPHPEEEKFIFSLGDKSFMKTMDKRELEESERLLYVALTRAIDSVCLTWTGKVQKKSWADCIGFNLSVGIHKANNYTYEVMADWEDCSFESLQSVNEVSLSEKYLSKETKDISFKKYSVSSLVDGTVKEKVVKKDNDAESVDTYDRVMKPVEGVLLHSILESLKYSDTNDLKELVQQRFLHKASEVLPLIDRVLNMADVPMKKIIENGQVEWGYQQKTAEGVLEGQVDLWGIVDSIAWLVDYKSGSKFYSKKAFAQLEIYAKALRAFGVESPIKMAIVYPKSGESIVQSYQG